VRFWTLAEPAEHITSFSVGNSKAQLQGEAHPTHTTPTNEAYRFISIGRQTASKAFPVLVTGELESHNIPRTSLCSIFVFIGQWLSALVVFLVKGLVIAEGDLETSGVTPNFLSFFKTQYRV
jgi:hypothetical protein